MKVLSLATATLTAGLFAGTAAHGATIELFSDSFNRANDTDLNASTTGMTGALAPLTWVEKNYNGTASISSNALLLDATLTGGNDGAMVYIDNNFTGLTSFEVRMGLLAGASGGDGRHIGFGIGQSKAELEAQTVAGIGGNQGDLFIGYDNIGTTKNIQVRKNGVLATSLNPTLSFPDTLSAKFTFANMNSGTTVSYEIFLNDVSIGTGSTLWSGTNENYISFASNYTNNSTVDFVTVNGELVPEPGSLALLGLGGLLIARRRRASL